MLTIEQIKETVREAAKLATGSSFEIYKKESEENIVTSSDIAIQNFLETRLTSLFPDSGFFGEETEPENADKKYCWIVDPIDGTQNYARGLNQSAICVALREDNQIIKAVVYNPFLDDMFWAEKGKGAYLNGRKLKVANTDFKHSLLCTAMSLYNKDYAKICNDIIMDTYYKCNDVRRFGVCSLELCYMADARCDLYFEYRLYPWDFAAASLILTEAGGFIGSPADLFSLSQPCPVIAANSKENYEKLESIVNNYIKSVPYRQ